MLSSILKGIQIVVLFVILSPIYLPLFGVFLITKLLDFVGRKINGIVQRRLMNN